MSKNEKGFLEHEQTELEKKKGRIANWTAIIVIISAVLIAIGFATGHIALVIALAVVNILFGPVTLFFYLREVKRGIFRADVEADAAEEA